MIETEQSIAIDASIDSVWNYVRDIRNWANLFPGCRECTVINEQESRWILKVGAGGLVRNVDVLVRVDRWDGPGCVDFSYKLERDPVEGNGSYRAVRKNGSTEITMNVRVVGTGSMAPMWEAMSRPLLPQLAKSFAAKLKAEIELVAGKSISREVVVPESPSILSAIITKLRNSWQAKFG